jgi:hypothetical protein
MRNCHIVASLCVLLIPSIVVLPFYGQKVRVRVDTYNVPNEIDACMKRLPGLAINGEMNPFYLSADFDGDGRLDFAIQVVRAEVKGIVVCLSSQKAPMVPGGRVFFDMACVRKVEIQCLVCGSKGKRHFTANQSQARCDPPRHKGGSKWLIVLGRQGFSLGTAQRLG